jgi:hypothetical protein
MPKTSSLRSLLRNRRGYRLLQQKLLSIARASVPAAIALSFATFAHAQGTMDFSGAQTLMGTFKTFAVYAGAVICFGGLIFAGIRMMSGRFQDAIPGLFGALFGAGVLGWGAGWIGAPGRQADGSPRCLFQRGLECGRQKGEANAFARSQSSVLD